MYLPLRRKPINFEISMFHRTVKKIKMLPFLATIGVFSANHKDSGQSFKSIITKFTQTMYLPFTKKQLNFETLKLHRSAKIC